MKVQDLSLPIPACSAVGDFLVLQNLLKDLKIASNWARVNWDFEPMMIQHAAKLAAFFILLMAATVAAQNVTLKSPDGSVEVNGTLLGFDGDFYRLETVYG